MLQDLDPTLIDALDELRREFDDKLNQQRLAFEQLVGSPSQPLEVEPEVDVAELSPVAMAPATVASLEPLEELKLAAAEIDRSESQGDVLDALIRGALRFSSRTAIFLCRDGAFHGWGGAGFGDKDSTIKDLALEAPTGSAWEQILAGEGGICLSAEDCSVLLDQIGTDGAEIGVLVPFILRRQVAAVVYSDRTSTDHSFNISGLQLLSFLAGVTVETLPIRERASTDSLQLAVAPEIPLAAPADEIAAPLEVEPEDEAPYLPEPQIEEPAAEELAIEEPSSEEPTIEDLLEETPPPVDTIAESHEPEPEPTVADEPQIEEAQTGEAAIEIEPDPIDELLAAPVSTPEMPELVAPEPEIPGLDADLDTSAFDAPPIEAPVEAAEPIAEPEIAPEPPESEIEAEHGEPEPEPEVAQDSGPPASTPEVAAAEPPGLTSTQVQPPQDVEGPGWAFTTTRIPTAAGAEALHEEARRLARLLVTEIKLYNEELVEEGRQSGDVYSRLREDIDRSRQIFDDRIDPEVRTEKDYFREALVRILAGGDSKVMGIPD
jgi:hypothetical protein